MPITLLTSRKVADPSEEQRRLERDAADQKADEQAQQQRWEDEARQRVEEAERAAKYRFGAPTVRAMLTSIRACPGDQTTRLILADYLEEFHCRSEDGEGGEMDQLAVRALRAGAVLPNDLDLALMRVLFYRVRTANRSPDEAWWQIPPFFSACFHQGTLTPADYGKLWALAWKYRRQIDDPDVLAEAAAVHEEQLARDQERLVQMDKRLLEVGWSAEEVERAMCGDPGAGLPGGVIDSRGRRA